MTGGAKLDVDFSLAIHNRTGKYFIGRDLLATNGLPIADVRYWYLKRRAPPKGLYGGVIGRLQHLHIRGRTIGGAMGWLPRRRSARPLLHLDPFTVPSTVLRRRDAVLCHDLGPITHPELFAAEVSAIYRAIYREIADVGPHLICVSEASLRSFATLYPAARPASRRVIYPALRPDLSSAAARAMPGIEPPFLLTVGSIGARKNQARCIDAFARSGLHARGVRYVLCGGPEPGFAQVAAAAAATPGVVLLGYVADAELSWLYGAASGFVLASLLEGFGMPVAEAIARGLVPLVSRGSVLEEVAGEGAIGVDPLDPDEIAARMIALVELDAGERARRRRLLGRSLDRFSIERVRETWRSALAEIVEEETA